MYLYELHCHTQETSRCGLISAKDLVEYYHKLGYTGICITDHFLNGNTIVPHDLPWEERITQFIKGYQVAKEAGDKLGMDVFFGWEYSFWGTDFLTYGLDENWLYNNPDCLKWRVSEYCDRVHQDGGFIVHAHPFREANYIEMIRLMPRHVDGVEVINACRLDFENKLADQYADNYNLLKTASSDNHEGRIPRIAAMEFSERKRSIHEVIEGIKKGEAKLRLFNIEELEK